jgi:glyoxylase-like metal-dependent hydrolase (beta-lactamase superfamily II)
MPGIYRLILPFDTVYTSVFLIKLPDEYVLVDCATTDEDVDKNIVPALAHVGISLEDVTKVVVTHNHSDHSGGLSRVLALAPHVEVVRDVRELGQSLCTYPLPGHTQDFIGVLDLRTHTLITGDGLQGAGVDKYRCSLADKSAYRETLDKIRRDSRVENLLFSHAYEPWYVDKIFGRLNVLEVISKCEEYM